MARVETMRDLLDQCVRRPSGCIEWTGPRHTRKGYGMVTSSHGRYAHRVAWKLAHGRIRRGMHVLHSCDNRLCVNPTHLRLGTNTDNVRDKVTRGRAPSGESHPNSKLDARTVAAIRAAHARDGTSFAVLGRRYGVHRSTIKRICDGDSWPGSRLPGGGKPRGRKSP